MQSFSPSHPSHQLPMHNPTKPVRNVACAHCADVRSHLKLCSHCTTVAYCSRDCQKAAWPSHARICKTASRPSEEAPDDGLNSILYDRALGGFLSIAQRRMFVAQGPGVMLATLSAPLHNYANLTPAHSPRPRTISLRYVPEPAIPTLDATLAGASQSHNMNSIQRAAEATKQLFLDVPGRYPGQIYVLVIRTSAHVEPQCDVKVSLMMNWLSTTHSAHQAFSESLPLTDQQLIGSIFNWDTREMILPRGCRMNSVPAKIVKTIISEEFYEQCVRTHRKRKSSLKNGEPVTEASLCPPLAQTLSEIQSLPC